MRRVPSSARTIQQNRRTAKSPPTAAASSHAPRLRPAAFACVLALTITATYANSITVPFLYDDVVGVVENSEIHDVTALTSVLQPHANAAPASGRPLLNLSFALNYAAGGLDVRGYHLVNIALHIAVALLLFALVRSVVPLYLPEEWPTANWLAGAIAALWALHPMLTGTVTYVSGRSESLMAVWYLATLVAAVAAHRSRHAVRWQVLAVCACALGMASKESMVTAPIAVVLLDRAYAYPSLRAALRQRGAFYGALAATWIVLALVIWQAPRSQSAGFSTGVSIGTYLLHQAKVIPEYLRLAAWPNFVLFAFGEAEPIRFADVGLLAAVVPLAAAFAVWLWWRSPAAGFPAIWVFLTLAPTSSIVPIATEVGALRRMYLPLAGIATLVVLAGWALTRRGSLRWRARAPIVAGIACLGVVIALAVTTAMQNRVYASEERLWRISVARWPSALAHRNLATTLKHEGKREEVLEHLRATLAVHPEERYTVGVELLEQGRAAEAIPELRRVLTEYSHDPVLVKNARIALAEALMHTGAAGEAAAVYGDILAADASDPNARLGRAQALFASGRYAQAIDAYRAVLADRPGDYASLTNLGISLMNEQRFEEAVPVLQRAADAQPENAAAQLNLAAVLYTVRRFDSAAQAAQRALTLEPESAPARELYEQASAAARRVRPRS